MKYISYWRIVELAKILELVQESVEGYKTIQKLVKNYSRKYC